MPKVTVCVGGAAGDELWTLCGPSCNPAFYFMWPRARMTKSDPFMAALEMKKGAEGIF